MTNPLNEAFENYIQERISTCITGLLDRVERLEKERLDADAVIRAQARQIETIFAAIGIRAEEIDRLVESRRSDRDELEMWKALVEKSIDELKSSSTDNLEQTVRDLLDDFEVVTENSLRNWCEDNLRIVC